MSRRDTGVGRVPAAPPSREPDTVSLARCALFVRRHLWPLLAMVTAGATIGLVAAILAPKTYTASVTVLAPGVALHAGQPPGPDRQTAKRPRDATVDTDAQLVRGREVLSRLAAIPGFRTRPDRLKSRIKVTAAPHSRVLTISVSARSPRQAQQGAEIAAEAYLNLRHEILGGIQQRNREALERREKLLEEQLKGLPDEDASLSRLTVRTRRQAVEKQIGQVRKELSAIDGQTVQSGEVLRGAALPHRPEDRRRDVALSSGAALGLLLGLLGALWQDRRPRPIRTADALRAHAPVPVLGTAVDRQAREDICRRLRNMVFDEEARAVLVTGLPGAAAVPVARELSILCAAGGVSTTLLRLGDDESDDPASTRVAGAAPSGAANGHPAGGRGGDRPDRTRPDPSSTSSAARPDRTRPDGYGLEEAIYIDRAVRHSGDRDLRTALERARKVTSLVVVTGPELGGPDALTLATFCDLTVLTVERGSAVNLEVARGVAALEEVGVTVRGAVVTEPPAAASRKSR